MNNIIKYSASYRDELTYIKKLVRIVTATYFENSLADRELDFFAICILGLRKTYTNPNKDKFFDLFNQYYFNDRQSKTQKASLLCTQRKNLIKKDFLFWDKNTEILSVSSAWKKHLDNVIIEINLSYER